MAARSPPYSNLDLVARVDRWPYFTTDPSVYKQHMLDYYYFHVEGFTAPFGYIHRSFVRQMTWPDFWEVDHDERFVTLTTATTFEERTSLMEKTLRLGIESGQVEELDIWVNELFPVYGSTGDHVFNMDGCGLDVFGVVNFAVHMIGYVKTKDGLRYWVPRRSRHKRSYPAMLDNTVGGSLSAGERPIDCIIRESQEEISLDPEYTRSTIKACGTASYQMNQTDAGRPGCQHQVQYLYELEFDEDITPTIGDGEVEELNLMSLDEVQAALANGEFKLNCAITWLAFLIRHGHITAENEENLLEICARLHRKHDIFVV